MNQHVPAKDHSKDDIPDRSSAKGHHCHSYMSCSLETCSPMHEWEEEILIDMELRRFKAYLPGINGLAGLRAERGW
jgi:hypothetical protein